MAKRVEILIFIVVFLLISMAVKKKYKAKLLCIMVILE